MTHTEKFGQHRARREAERAATAKVTWRKVSDLTGGGWSGLGPGGELVWVGPAPGSNYFHAYGRIVDGRRERVGGCPTLATAKRAAEALFIETFREEVTTMTDIKFVDLPEGVEVVPAARAGYVRLRAGGKTLAYAVQRKNDVALDFAAKDVEEAPKRFQEVLEDKGTRRRMVVAPTGARQARNLLEWLAKRKTG